MVTARQCQHAYPLATQVPEGHLWIEGDNGPNSRDSRSYGPVPVALVEGRAVGRVRAARACATGVGCVDTPVRRQVFPFSKWKWL